MDNSQCVKCKNSVLMLDGNLWCGLTMKPVGKDFLAICPNFELGSGKIYKSEPTGMPDYTIPKVKIRKIKAKPITKISKKKIKPPQPRLF